MTLNEKDTHTHTTRYQDIYVSKKILKNIIKNDIV